MTDDQLSNIRERLKERNAPIDVPADYDPRCTCGSLIPECKACKSMRIQWQTKRERYAQQAPNDVADLLAEVERLRELES